tara:strand:+ start:363 stop:611 length:249 start_codon:yes stop_codon:yes gene_type:complete
MTEKSEGNILTPQQIQMAENAEPHEVLFAIHKRVVDTEKLMRDYRTLTQNLMIDIEMMKERIKKLENENEERFGYNVVEEGD